MSRHRPPQPTREIYPRETKISIRAIPEGRKKGRVDGGTFRRGLSSGGNPRPNNPCLVRVLFGRPMRVPSGRGVATMVRGRVKSARYFYCSGGVTNFTARRRVTRFGSKGYPIRLVIVGYSGFGNGNFSTFLVDRV